MTWRTVANFETYNRAKLRLTRSLVTSGVPPLRNKHGGGDRRTTTGLLAGVTHVKGFSRKTSVRVLSHEAGSRIRRVSQGLSTFQVRKVKRASVGEARGFHSFDCSDSLQRDYSRPRYAHHLTSDKYSFS